MEASRNDFLTLRRLSISEEERIREVAPRPQGRPLREGVEPRRPAKNQGPQKGGGRG